MPESQDKQTKSSLRIGTDIHLILQQRDIRLFDALAVLRIVDREQARLICGFNSLTRVNTRLLKLRRAGLLKRFFFVSPHGGKSAIYTLTQKAAALIGSTLNNIKRPADSFLFGDKFAAHQLAINQVYCACNFQPHPSEVAVKRWKSFAHSLSPALSLIPDAYFEIHFPDAARSLFLEVDLGTEGLTVWNKKIEQYLTFASSGEYNRFFHAARFSVLVVTSSEGRLQSLRACIKRHTSKIYYLTTFKRMREQGFWNSIWFRPEGENLRPLI